MIGTSQWGQLLTSQAGKYWIERFWAQNGRNSTVWPVWGEGKVDDLDGFDFLKKHLLNECFSRNFRSNITTPLFKSSILHSVSSPLHRHRRETELLAGAIAEGLLASPVGKTSIAVFTEGMPGARRCLDFLRDFLKKSLNSKYKRITGRNLQFLSYHCLLVTPVPHIHVFWADTFDSSKSFLKRVYPTYQQNLDIWRSQYSVDWWDQRDATLVTKFTSSKWVNHLVQVSDIGIMFFLRAST